MVELRSDGEWGATGECSLSGGWWGTGGCLGAGATVMVSESVKADGFVKASVTSEKLNSMGISGRHRQNVLPDAPGEHQPISCPTSTTDLPATTSTTNFTDQANLLSPAQKLYICFAIV